MTEPPAKVFVFQCSGNTYMECIEKSVFGANDPWPLQVKKGDWCLRHHYEYDTLIAPLRIRNSADRAFGIMGSSVLLRQQPPPKVAVVAERRDIRRPWRVAPHEVRRIAGRDREQ